MNDEELNKCSLQSHQLYEFMHLVMPGEVCFCLFLRFYIISTEFVIIHSDVTLGQTDQE